MSKIDDVRKEMMQALKNGDKPRKEALSLLLSALKNKAIEKREDLTDEEANAIVYKEIKEAKETIETTPAERNDIIDDCKYKINVYEAFAPRQMSREEVTETVKAVLAELSLDAPTAKDKGNLMKALMPRVKGKADGALVNQVVSELLK